MELTIFHIAGKFGRAKFGEFGESFVIHQTKIIQISTYNTLSIGWSINLLNFLSQKLKQSQFAKLSRYMVVTV